MAGVMSRLQEVMSLTLLYHFLLLLDQIKVIKLQICHVYRLGGQEVMSCECLTSKIQ